MGKSREKLITDLIAHIESWEHYKCSECFVCIGTVCMELTRRPTWCTDPIHHFLWNVFEHKRLSPR